MCSSAGTVSQRRVRLCLRRGLVPSGYPEGTGTRRARYPKGTGTRRVQNLLYSMLFSQL